MEGSATPKSGVADRTTQDLARDATASAQSLERIAQSLDRDDYYKRLSNLQVAFNHLSTQALALVTIAVALTAALYAMAGDGTAGDGREPGVCSLRSSASDCTHVTSDRSARCDASLPFELSGMASALSFSCSATLR